MTIDHTAERRARAPVPARVMACMSASALSPRVLRSGARMAHQLGAPWYAVYVETPPERGNRIRPSDLRTLQDNVGLAERLGATIVRVKAGRPADGLIAFAQREAISHVIFGESARPRWERLLRGSTIDRFVAAIPDAAVQVVALDDRP